MIKGGKNISMQTIKEH